MSRLNLDIFGSDKSRPEERQHDKTEPSGEGVTNAANKSVGGPASEPSVPGSGNASPRFVPVGFYEEHLRLLDEAVFALRQKGFRKASKSALVRRLIEIHRDELPRIYLDDVSLR